MNAQTLKVSQKQRLLAVAPGSRLAGCRGSACCPTFRPAITCVATRDGQDRVSAMVKVNQLVLMKRTAPGKTLHSANSLLIDHVKKTAKSRRERGAAS